MKSRDRIWDVWLKRFAPIAHRKSWHILLVAVATSVAGGYFSMPLLHNLRTDMAEMLPDSFQSVQTLHQIEARLGGLGNLRLAIECPDLGVAQRYAETLAPLLLESPLVNYLDYKNDVAFFKQYGLLYLEVDELYDLQDGIEKRINKEKQRLNPFMVDNLFGEDDAETGDDDSTFQQFESKYAGLEHKEYYTNPDSTLIVMDVYPKGTSSNIAFARKLLAEIQGIVNASNPKQYHPQLAVLYGGKYQNQIDEYQVILNDVLGKAVPGLLSIVLIIMIFFFLIYRPDRDTHIAGRFVNRLLVALFAGVVICVPLSMSLLWTFGVTGLVIGSLNSITAFLFVILFGLGIDFGIHVFARYMEGRNRGEDCRTVLETTIITTGKALATTALTTAAAFYTLLITDFRGFSELGFIAGTGVLFALIAMITVLPAMVALGERWHLLRFRKHTVEAGDAHIERRPFPLARSILVAGIVLTLFLGFMALRVEFEYDFSNLRSNLPETLEFREKIRGVFNLSESPAVVLSDSKAEAEEVVAAVRARKAQDTESPTIDVVRSVQDLVPAEQEDKLDIIAEIHELITGPDIEVLTGDDLQKVQDFQEYTTVEETFTIDETPLNIKRKFIGRDGKIGDFVFIYPDVPLRDGRNAILFAEDVREIPVESGKTYYASSSNIIMADLLLVMMQDGEIAVSAALLTVLLLLWWDFRHFRRALQVLTPLLVGVIWMLGIMGLTGMKLNFYNIVVIPAIIGIGIDNGVHVYHRYLQEGRLSLPFILRHTGLALIMTNLTTLQGFSGLVFAWHTGLQSIGSLALIGITSAFISAVTILPAWIQVAENKKAKE